MKIYRNIFSAAMCVIAGATVIACSDNLDDYTNQSANGENLVFKVNMNAPADYIYDAETGTRAQASNNKTTWNLNDVVYFMVDNNPKNLGKFTRTGKEGKKQGDIADSVAYADWAVSKVISEPYSFQEGEGVISCFYSDNTTFSKASEIYTSGDVLYKDTVPYVRIGDTVTINATLDKRPVSKVFINGVYPWNTKRDTLSIVGFKESSLLNIGNLYTKGADAWIDQNLNGLANAVEDKKGTTVAHASAASVSNICYYGYIPDCPKGPTIVLKTNDGKVTYSRKFPASRQLSAGKYITMKGPADSTACKNWNTVTYGDTIYSVQGTTAKPIKVACAGKFSFRVGQIQKNFTDTTYNFTAYDTLGISSVNFESSDESVVTVAKTNSSVTSSWAMTMLKAGTAVITASVSPSAKDTAYYTVIVKPIEDYLVGKWPTTYTKATATSNALFWFSLKNNNPCNGKRIRAHWNSSKKPDGIATVADGLKAPQYVVLNDMYVRYANGKTSSKRTLGYTLLLGKDIANETAAGKVDLKKYEMDDGVDLTYLNGSTLVIDITFNGEARTVEIPFTGSVDANGNVSL